MLNYNSVLLYFNLILWLVLFRIGRVSTTNTSNSRCRLPQFRLILFSWGTALYLPFLNFVKYLNIGLALLRCEELWNWKGELEAGCSWSSSLFPRLSTEIPRISAPQRGRSSFWLPNLCMHSWSILICAFNWARMGHPGPSSRTSSSSRFSWRLTIRHESLNSTQYLFHLTDGWCYQSDFISKAKMTKSPPINSLSHVNPFLPSHDD